MSLGKRQSEALQLLKEHGESTTRELANHAEASEDAIRRSLNRLSDGPVEKRVNPRNPYQKLWKVVSDE